MKSALMIGLIYASTAFGQEALPDKAPAPKDNPMSKEKIELGKQLFFDPRLSSTGAISCNSCHNVMAGGDDARAGSVGVRGQVGGRSSPTVWNAAFQSVQFWDGRAPTLEAQAKGPLINPVEMGMKSHEVVITDRIAKIPGYQTAFKKAFGADGAVTIDNVAKAIAAFERTLITPKSPFDKYIKGNKKAMSSAAIKGFETFKTTGCVACHSGRNFSGPTMAEGTGFFQKFPMFPNADIEKKYAFQADLGKMKETKVEGDKHMFRVPTLRNIALTAPYFHNGAVKDLREAVRVMAKLQLNKDLSAEDQESIATFLTEGLTGEFPAIVAPRLPELPGQAFALE